MKQDLIAIAIATAIVAIITLIAIRADARVPNRADPTPRENLIEQIPDMLITQQPYIIPIQTPEGRRGALACHIAFEKEPPRFDIRRQAE